MVVLQSSMCSCRPRLPLCGISSNNPPCSRAGMLLYTVLDRTREPSADSWFLGLSYQWQTTRLVSSERNRGWTALGSVRCRSAQEKAQGPNGSLIVSDLPQQLDRTTLSTLLRRIRRLTSSPISSSSSATALLLTNHGRPLCPFLQVSARVRPADSKGAASLTLQ